MNDRGQWIQTYTGISFYPLDPRPEDINISDIARALSMICRYNGHTKFHYSVAQHSWIIAEYVYAQTKDPGIALQALLHDASEAYICDIPRPLKPSLTNYKEIEKNIMDCVYHRFSIPMITDPIVKKADDLILNDERAALMSKCGKEWSIGREFLGVEIERMMPSEAEKKFLDLYAFLENVLDYAYAV